MADWDRDATTFEEEVLRLTNEARCASPARAAAPASRAESPTFPGRARSLDDEQLNLNEPDGWIISEDRKKVTVQGKACQEIPDGTKQKLLVKVLCEVVVPE